MYNVTLITNTKFKNKKISEKKIESIVFNSNNDSIRFGP